MSLRDIVKNLFRRPPTDTQIREVADALAADAGPIISYTNILREHGVGSHEAEAFFNTHKASQTFVRLAKGADALFQHKDQILQELDQLEQDEIFAHVAPEWHKDFKYFTETGKAKPKFLAYLETDALARKAVERVYMKKFDVVAKLHTWVRKHNLDFE
jgi:hypothetical protein